MTSEEDFQRVLDRTPSDWQTRLVFADWLQDRDDARAAGYRALGSLRVYPLLITLNGVFHEDNPWYFVFGTCANTVPESKKWSLCKLPTRWFLNLMRGSRDVAGPSWCHYRMRRIADNDAAWAFSKLTPKEQAEILSLPAVILKGWMRRGMRMPRKYSPGG